ncbi:MAG: sulfur oxidation c-type cytochrome SoxA [Burkholderiaceae bacterium]
MNHRAATLLLMLGSWLSLASAQPWPEQQNLSGNAFLTRTLLTLQNSPDSNPISLWLEQGQVLWRDGRTGPSCSSCHGAIDKLKNAAPSFPRLSADGAHLINLEDQIIACRNRSGRNPQQLEDLDILALSAALHQTAKAQPINVKPLPHQTDQWQQRFRQGSNLFNTRLGRMNLACVHCHANNVGRQMSADVISPGHPTGFPIYRMSWQGMGSIDRRLRACYSGVQAIMPAPGDPVLRDLELYLKVRANGMPMDGPSIRR